MANLTLVKLFDAQLSSYPIKEGQILYTIDKAGCYIDSSNEKRVPIKQIQTITEKQKADMVTATEGFYYVADANSLYYYHDDWMLINERTDLSGITATLDEIKQSIEDLKLDTSDATAVAADILKNKTAYIDGEKVIGTMANSGAMNKTLDGMTATSVTIPGGYTTGGKVTLTDSIEKALAAI